MATETLRPNGVGDETNITSQTPATGDHWDKVDEASADDATTTVQHNTDSTSGRDLYTLENSSIGAGTINKITVYIRGEGTVAWFKSAIKEGGTITESAQFSSSGDDTFETKSTDYTTNPRTASAWQWSEIDSLQVGCVSYRDPIQQGRITQVYVVVDYTPATTAYTLTAVVGTFTLTGKNVTLTKALTMLASVGSFVLTGYSIITTRGFMLYANTGSFILTGYDIIITKTLSMLANTGVFTLTGNAVTFARKMLAGAGTFNLTGNAITFARKMIASVGAFTFTGNDIIITRGYKLFVTTGSFILTGYDIVIRGWFTIVKNTTNWVNGSKNTSSWSNSTKNSSIWTNKDKTLNI